MIVHPSLDRGRLGVCGGRLLSETFGLIGVGVYYPHETRTEWGIEGLYAPIRGRALGGIRARVIDQKNVVSFINQRDLELLLGLAKPGDYCPWLGSDYVDPYDRAWLGFCMDEEDLRDDLYARESELRYVQEQMTGSPVLPSDLEIDRIIRSNSDARELLVLLFDFDQMTGISPDTRLETVDLRWKRFERQGVTWHQL
jgi:hypothetical protein